jgi:hypothetical protein
MIEIQYFFENIIRSRFYFFEKHLSLVHAIRIILLIPFCKYRILQFFL